LGLSHICKDSGNYDPSQKHISDSRTLLFWFFGRCLLLRSNEFWIVDEAVFVLIVTLEDRVDHVLQLLVLEDLLLGDWLT